MIDYSSAFNIGITMDKKGGKDGGQHSRYNNMSNVILRLCIFHNGRWSLLFNT